ncbi:Oidioi.mRNA.OKI2018_I69.chr2.g8196.t1.cds [Oikopleura dioica]|uniref:Oidioi.mRNA.OKI2018_I69.chr2.g8196.t1.cds n=1 Tax=Oikopleura dioica TaxID=34765 RepID=A0ABN7T8I3_OIKDI|nr:Oidioi.mRNA.OKI2018_I69.chr2.g8196.t1.cds [Oikopleura dioica]
MTRIGIVGFGKLGQETGGRAIYDYAEKSAHLEVAWVWNRSMDKLLDLPEEKILEDLDDIPDMPLQAELIVEVAHPAIWANHAETLLSQADVLIGSPSGLSVQEVEDNVRTLCQKHRRSAFVARGALWGSEDIFRMRDSIAQMHITMSKHPSHLKLHSDLASKMPKDHSGIRRRTNTCVRIHASVNETVKHFK